MQVDPRTRLTGPCRFRQAMPSGRICAPRTGRTAAEPCALGPARTSRRHMRARRHVSRWTATASAPDIAAVQMLVRSAPTWSARGHEGGAAAALADPWVHGGKFGDLRPYARIRLVTAGVAPPNKALSFCAVTWTAPSLAAALRRVESASPKSWCSLGASNLMLEKSKLRFAGATVFSWEACRNALVWGPSTLSKDLIVSPLEHLVKAMPVLSRSRIDV